MEQARFRAGKSAIDHLFRLTQIVEKNSIYYIFIIKKRVITYISSNLRFTTTE